MSELIDIFVKLQIALITLLVPMLIFYINHAFNAKKVKEIEYNNKLEDLQKNAKLDAGDTVNFANQVKDLHSQITSLTTKRKGNLNLLDPLRQMKIIYGTLLSSFAFLVLDIAVRNSILITYNHYLSCVLLTLSFILFVVVSCWVARIAIVAIKSKEDTENP